MSYSVQSKDLNSKNSKNSDNYYLEAESEIKKYVLTRYQQEKDLAEFKLTYKSSLSKIKQELSEE